MVALETRLLPRSFYRRDVLSVAPELLNKLLFAGGACGRIVEVEAYAAVGDQASHSFRGPTRRNASMFGRPGLLYVYFTYGMHWCANVVCEDEGVGAAVLIRALEPVTGIEAMRRRRPRARADHDLCSGPAKLCQALLIDGRRDGVDLARARSPVRIADDGTPPPTEPENGPRIGIRRSVELPWRWLVADSPSLSRRR